MMERLKEITDGMGIIQTIFITIVIIVISIVIIVVAIAYAITI